MAQASLSQSATPKGQVEGVYDALASFFPEEVEGSNEGNLKVNLFKEIVRRSIADVSGHLNLPSQGQASDVERDQRITIGRVFKGIDTSLGALGVSDAEDILQFFLGNVSGYTKTIVQTPHPTEMLDSAAITAEENLLNALENNARALFHRSRAPLLPNNESAIRTSMKKLYDALIPPEKMKIADEMRRSVIFSERMFDAVPMIASRILQESYTDSRTLSDEHLQKFGHLVQPMTWSPGDQDSKPNMTVEELKNGFALNKRAMLKHYAMRLVEIYAHMKEDTSVDQRDREKLITMVRGLLATARDYEENGSKSGQSFDQYVRETLNSEAQRRVIDSSDVENGEARPSLGQAIETIAEYEAQPVNYNHVDDLVSDLASLRQSQYNFDIKINGQSESLIGAIDALIIQAHNFGLTALKSQIRQNQDKHSKVFDHILDLLKDEMHDIKSPADLLEKLRDTDVRHRVKAKVNEALEEIEKKDATEPASSNGGEDLDEAHTYQVLKSIEFATKHPDFIPHYLIAECGGPDEDGNPRSTQEGRDDMLKALALITIMQPDDAKQFVEVVPLVEHPYQVTEDEQGKIPYVDMMKAVFENKDFRSHQQRVSESYRHLLTHTTIADGKVASVSLTGTDLIASINPEFRSDSCALKSNDQPVTMVKLCMGAGSDVTKFGGAAAAAMMQNAMYKLKEELAGLENPVRVIDYLGCGGGVHRTQPVANTAETAQGRSMRQTPDAIATKTTALLARFVRDSLASGAKLADQAKLAGQVVGGMVRWIKPKDRHMLAQLNMGNLANLPRNPSVWNRFSKDIVQQASKNYQEFTKSDAYCHMLAYTADPFCKMTSYADRPASRLGAGAEEDTEFPPPVDMSKLRAIGYGGALNVSGSCASLYLGLDNIAQVDTKELVRHYQFDPLLQDTINRATYGIVMSDMKTAWKYVGIEGVPDPEELEQLAQSKPPASDRLQQAKKALAAITLEREAIGRKLVELHSELQNSKTENRQQNLDEQLLSVLPSEYADQLRASKANLEAPRQALADLFQQALRDNNNSSLGGQQSYRDIIHPAMATIFECFEHAPRAITSPNWGLQESSQSLAV